MTVRLNNRAYDHAKKLINEGKLVYDQRDAWSEHQPSTQKKNEFINDEYRQDTKRHYEFPYHCCPVNKRIDSTG